MYLLFYILGIFSLIITLISFIKNDYWLIRICDFPRLQIAFLALLSLLIGIYLKKYSNQLDVILLILFSIVFIFQSYKVAPYTKIWKRQVLPIDTQVQKESIISIFIANIFMENKNYDKCLASIAQCNPDIIFILEANQEWKMELDVLCKEYPFKNLYPLETTYGLLFYSRLKISEMELRFLLTKEIPSIKTKITLGTGEKIMFYGLHPKPPAPQEAETTTKRDAELILVAKEILESGEPSIVAGDLNDVAWSRTSALFQKISKLLDPRIGRGLYASFHSKYWLFRWPLDHVFHSIDFKLIELKRQKNICSDHFPIFIKLAFLPEEKHHHDEIQPDSEDIKEGNEKLAKAKTA